MQKKREFFQVRRLPAGKAFPWPADKPECRRRPSFGADVFRGDTGGGSHVQDIKRAVPQRVMHREDARDPQRSWGDAPVSQTLQSRIVQVRVRVL